MVQWINGLQNNGFINLAQLMHLLCEKTGAIALAQLGLMAGIQAGTQTDEMLLHVKIFTIINIGNLVAFRKVQCHHSGTNTV